MKADKYGTQAEQRRSNLGWIAPLMRRQDIRRGERLEEHHCATCIHRLDGDLAKAARPSPLCSIISIATSDNATCDHWKKQ